MIKLFVIVLLGILFFTATNLVFEIVVGAMLFAVVVSVLMDLVIWLCQNNL